MFGFSLTKLLFTVVVIVAVWYGFKWVGRMQSQRSRPPRAMRRRPARRSAETIHHEPANDTQDMVQCPTCGDFVPGRGMRNCGRENCPYPG